MSSFFFNDTKDRNVSKLFFFIGCFCFLFQVQSLEFCRKFEREFMAAILGKDVVGLFMRRKTCVRDLFSSPVRKVRVLGELW